MVFSRDDFPDIGQGVHTAEFRRPDRFEHPPITAEMATSGLAVPTTIRELKNVAEAFSDRVKEQLVDYLDNIVGREALFDGVRHRIERFELSFIDPKGFEANLDWVEATFFGHLLEENTWALEIFNRAGSTVVLDAKAFATGRVRLPDGTELFAASGHELLSAVVRWTKN